MESLKKETAIFVIYSKEDNEIRERIMKHLSPLEQHKSIKIWYDGLIEPGSNWKKEIIERLHSSQIVLALISADFISSDYCYNIELDKALEKHNRGETTLIPIIVSSCDWEDTKFSSIQVLPEDGIALKLSQNLDHSITKVVQKIKNQINGFNKKNTSFNKNTPQPKSHETISRLLKENDLLRSEIETRKEEFQELNKANVELISKLNILKKRERNHIEKEKQLINQLEESNETIYENRKTIREKSDHIEILESKYGKKSDYLVILSITIIIIIAIWIFNKIK